MKKTVIVSLMLVLVSSLVFSLDFTFSGEVKTGFYTEQTKDQSGTQSKNKIHNNDGDSGREARIRLNLNMETEYFGMRTRYTQFNFEAENNFLTEFIYAYADLYDKQFRICAGMLGESPWGAGGPDLWAEVDDQLGMRFEWKPNFVPGLNLGVVLNTFNAKGMQPNKPALKFTDILLDSVLGIAYENDFFAFRFAYRMDTPADWAFQGDEGSAFVYRLEERILSRWLPGFQIFLNGQYYGIGAIISERQDWVNWVYIQYNHNSLSAYFYIRHYENMKIERIKSDDGEGNIEYFKFRESEGSTLRFKTGFLYKLFDDLLSIGTGLGMEIGIGNTKINPASFYNFWWVEPQVRFNFNSNAYVALVYSFQDGYNKQIDVFKSTTNWLNIRLCYYF